MFSTVVFDMDGTLLDTLGDLAGALNHVLEQHNKKIQTIEEVRSHVGNGIRRLVELSLPEDTPLAEVDLINAEMQAYYKEHSCILTCAYPGVKEVLSALKEAGVKTAIVTNKPDAAAKELAELFFGGLYGVTEGERPGLAKKPERDLVDKALEELMVDGSDAVYVGDSETDVKTAENADLPCIAVTWGFRTKELLESLHPAFMADTAEELLEIIKRNGNGM